MNIQIKNASIEIKIIKTLTKLFNFLFPIKLNKGKVNNVSITTKKYL